MVRPCQRRWSGASKSHCDANFSIIYGQTEASPGITLVKLDDSPEDKANTLGPAMPQVEMKVVDPETGGDVADRRIG